jgi:hypothetical protein
VAAEIQEDAGHCCAIDTGSRAGLPEHRDDEFLGQLIENANHEDGDQNPPPHHTEEFVNGMRRSSDGGIHGDQVGGSEDEEHGDDQGVDLQEVVGCVTLQSRCGSV